jgi:hypothetical protein
MEEFEHKCCQTDAQDLPVCNYCSSAISTVGVSKVSPVPALDCHIAMALQTAKHSFLCIKTYYLRAEVWSPASQYLNI